MLGWTPIRHAVFGNTQHLPGYCLLFHRQRVEHLDALSDPERIAFLWDLSLLGEAVRIAITTALSAITDRVYRDQ